ncbi:hypothetical protein CEXT_150831 [Caerostris extrusa]|uniref:Ribosomal protein S15 n=1 Tax=Caerostris extrusa TaxID=172846 RepID=A0AAV4Y3K9_CAEEX|nr:hypothetical protein CEXT_150831 [Caerostris extrusa]
MYQERDNTIHLLLISKTPIKTERSETSDNGVPVSIGQLKKEGSRSERQVTRLKAYHRPWIELQSENTR